MLIVALIIIEPGCVQLTSGGGRVRTGNRRGADRDAEFYLQGAESGHERLQRRL